MGTDHELIRSIYAAANRGDFDTMLASFSPDIEWVTPTRTIRGLDALGGWLGGWSTSYSPTHEIEELMDIGDDVLALVTVTYQGRDPNTPAHIWTLRDGLVMRVHVHPVRAGVLRRLNIAPQASRGETPIAPSAGDVAV
ncbi:MAG: nuclear transport factor 2 family protein [Solirubrobacteraceae bacterium]